jgi:hypothetical protein
MSHHEIIHWWRYYCENPFGYRRNDLREALNCAVVAAPHSKKSLPLTSFLLVPEEKKKLSNKEISNKLHAILGGAKNGNRTS